MARVARFLHDFLDEIVFVGGCAAVVLVPPRAHATLRSTDDVDCVVQAATYGAYHQWAHRLRQSGCTEGGEQNSPICRWMVDGIRVDIMPTEKRALGFNNRWYAEVMRQPVRVEVAPDIFVKVANVPVFLATKFDAFSDRGEGRHQADKDIEDIVTLMAYRQDLVDLIRAAPEEVRTYLTVQVADLLALPDIEHIISGCLPADTASQSAVPEVLAVLRVISSR